MKCFIKYKRFRTFALFIFIHCSLFAQTVPKGNRASATNMTGTVWLYPMGTDTATHWLSAKVTFEKGARSYWHYHPGKQVIHAVEGMGYLKEKDKPVQVLKKGDVAIIEPNVLHWHGAGTEIDFAQIVVSPNTEKGVVIWLEKVTDEEYLSALPPKKYQAKAPLTKPFGKDAFGKIKNTEIRWLGMAGFLVNSRGTTFMIDPLLKDYDMPILMEFPIQTKDVPRLDAVLATHSDNDHYSVPTFKDLSAVTKMFYSTKYVDTLMRKEGLQSKGYGIGELFQLGNTSVKLTPADHAWQNAYPGASNRFFQPEDACGFYFTTPDGTIWAPGDSKFMPEQLNLPAPDVILLYYSEDPEWHHGLQGSITLLNAYPKAKVLLSHWGFVDAPDFTPFNGDPKNLLAKVVNPERIYVLAPGEPFSLKLIKSK